MNTTQQNTEFEPQLLERIAATLGTLAEARKTHAEWSAVQASDYAEQRQKWMRDKNKASHYDASGDAKMAALEPGLMAMPEIKSQKARIATLRAELNAEEDRLRVLEEKGTPRDLYARVVETAEGLISQLADQLTNVRLTRVLLDSYGTADVNRLPSAVIDTAKLHPSVVKFSTFRFLSRLTNMREAQVTDGDIKRTDKAVSDALEQLRGLVAADM
jgi:hypothetical protein